MPYLALQFAQDTASDPGAALGVGIGGMAIGIGIAVLVVLTILMPLFVYLAQVYARQVRDEVKKTRDAIVWRLDTLIKEAREREPQE